MKKQREKLSYARLVTRADFYKNKALELEQQVVFANENASALEKQVGQMKEINKEVAEANEKKLKGLKELLENVETEHRRLVREHEKLQIDFEELKALRQEDKERMEEEKNRLEEETKGFNEKLAVKDKEIEELQSKGNEEKILGFEKLLSEVQVELNEKEALIDSYQKRIKNLEQRLNLNQKIPVNKVYASTEKSERVERKAIAFFDYSVVVNQNQEAVIRGNFHIENIGSEPLHTPYVCFRFYPVDASALKGRILSIEQLSLHDRTRKPQWMFMDGEWANSAEERGEIWVRPYEEWNLRSEEKLVLSDFQIPVRKHYDENVIVEGFVYFQKDEYKQKALNQILISF